MWKPTIECDESGQFWLYVETEYGDQTEMLHIEEPEAFYDAVKAGIGPWLHERELARRSAPTPLYVDDSGYDLSDPKHSEYHSIHADLYDNREGK